MFQALPAPLRMAPHLLSGSADREGKGSGFLPPPAAGLLPGPNAFSYLHDHFPVSRLGLVGVGGPIPARNMFGTLGESSRKTKGVLDGL